MMAVPAVSETTAPARRRRAHPVRQWLEVLPFLLPGLALFAIFVAWPLAQGLRISFYDWNIMPGAAQKFVGLANYQKAFVDPKVRLALANTLLYVVVTVPGQMFFGLLVAVGLNAVIRGRGAWRTLYYIPVLTSWVVVSFIFKYLFLGGQAPVNYLLKDILHLIPAHVDWLQNRWTAQVPITLLGIWKGVGWNAVMFLAGLAAIPRELYEAAAIDGASRPKTFFRITLPLLRPVLLFVAVMLTIGAFGVFISVHLMTGGGPLDKTQVLLSYMYTQGFSNFKFGYGFALAALLGLVIFGISVLQFRFVKNEMDV